MRLKPEHHQWIYIAGLLLVAVGLPLSKAAMSIGQMVLLGNWLWEGNLRTKWTRFKGIPAAWIFTSIFLLHVVGLLWTSDFDYALKDLRVKLPFLILPLVMATSNGLSPRQYRWLEASFIGAVLAGTLVSTGVWLGIIEREITDIRDISRFISHIRFSLLIAVAVFLLLRHFWSKRTASWLRMIALALAGWLVAFLFILQSFTGLAALLITGYLLLLATVFRNGNRVLRATAALVLIGLPLALGVYVVKEVRAFLPLNEPPWESLEAHSPRGEGYLHAPDRPSVESGRYVFRYVAHEELKQAWEARSSIPIDSLDQKGNHMVTTLLRFLTSKGLRKDLDGVAVLTDDEIHAIESGVANERFLHGNAFGNRIYKVIWQAYYYSIGHNPEGNSVTQRLEFWKTGWHIACSNWLIGVGTGDVETAFEQAYQTLDSPLREAYRHRAHNQYLTMLLTFGTLGFAWFVLALFLPALLEGRLFDFRFFAFFTIALASMLHEDTIETQAGVTFLVFLYGLFLFVRPRKM